MSQFQDTLLRHPVKPVEDKEAEAARLEELVQARAEYMALDELVKKGGWAVIRQKLRHDEQDILAKLELCQDPVSLSKLVGSLLACRGQLDYPPRRLAELEQLIKDLED